jgi:hypothetical protein
MAFRSVRRLKADAFSVFRKWVHLPSHRRRFPPYESGELVPWKDTWDKYRCQHSWLSREYRKGVSYQTQGQRVIQEKPRFSTPKRSSLKVPATVSKDPALLFNWGRRASCFSSRGGLRRGEYADEEEDWDSTLKRYASFGRNHILVLRASGAGPKSVSNDVVPSLGDEKEMKYTHLGFKIISLFALLVVAGFCGCASTEVQKSSAEKAREAWYSNYIDNTEKEWSTHF